MRCGDFLGNALVIRHESTIDAYAPSEELQNRKELKEHRPSLAPLVYNIDTAAKKLQ